MENINFDGKKPSKLQVIKRIKSAIQSGADTISVTWGENWIEIGYSFDARQWAGAGWIRDIGGDDIAIELNQLQKRG